MKRIYIAFFALLATTLCACSPTPSGSALATASPVSSPTATVTAMNTAEMEKKIIDLEKKTWDLFIQKNYGESAKVNAPGYQAIYFGKVKPDAEAAEDNKYIDFRGISFSDWKATFPTKDVVILTYKSTGQATFKGKDTSGTYVHSSAWVNINREWKQALYHETKAEPQPKK
jgi:hypothetical protein